MSMVVGRTETGWNTYLNETICNPLTPINTCPKDCNMAILYPIWRKVGKWSNSTELPRSTNTLYIMCPIIVKVNTSASSYRCNQCRNLDESNMIGPSISWMLSCVSMFCILVIRNNGFVSCIFPFIYDLKLHDE